MCAVKLSHSSINVRMLFMN